MKNIIIIIIIWFCVLGEHAGSPVQAQPAMEGLQAKVNDWLMKAMSIHGRVADADSAMYYSKQLVALDSTNAFNYYLMACSAYERWHIDYWHKASAELLRADGECAVKIIDLYLSKEPVVVNDNNLPFTAAAHKPILRRKDAEDKRSLIVAK